MIEICKICHEKGLFFLGDPLKSFWKQILEQILLQSYFSVKYGPALNVFIAQSTVNVYSIYLYLIALMELHSIYCTAVPDNVL